MSEQYDVAVIGGGPGGYVAGIRLGQLGKKTCVIEMGDLGGVCLNWGCIPSKAVIHAAEVRHESAHAKVFGIGSGELPDVDVGTLRDWKNGILKKLRGGIAGLLKANGVTHIKGRATLTGPTSLEVEGADGAKQSITFSQAIVATGARPFELPFLPRSHDRVWTSQELLELDEIPERLVCVGGGVIGIETACSYARLGSQVTIVELQDTILPGTDPDLVKPLLKDLKRQGVTIHTGTKSTGLTDAKDGAKLHCEKGGEAFDVIGDRFLVSVGFRPNSNGIGLEAAGVKLDDRGHIVVDPYCKTNVDSIYAIGDITGMPYLAHRASKQGVVAAEVIGGQPAMCDFLAMPLGIFSSPEIAMVGLMEAEAKQAGHDVKVGSFPFAALGRAMAQESTAGLVKVIGDAKTGQLLGVGIVGPRANDLIAEAALAIEMGAQVEDIALTVHTHPTFAEGMMEAAEDFLGHAIHVAKPKRKSAMQKQADQLLMKG